ncbi:MAG: amidohydrolase family protein [bacterium]
MPCSDLLRGSPSPAELILHRAAWILPISSPPVEDGIVAVRDGRIIEAGPAQSMRQKYVQAGGLKVRLIDHGDGAILPSLVNAHTHLELSCLAGRVQVEGDFVNWVRSLIQARQECSSQDTAAGIASAIRQLWQRGTGLVGDVSNTGASIAPLRESALAGRVFLEAIGFEEQKELENQQAIQAILSSYPLSGQGIHLCLAAHAPYSVSSRYLQFLRKSPLWPDRPFSIHVAEPREEPVFLSTGEGGLRSFLIEREAWDPAWVPPQATAVQYLYQQGILRPETICVHAVQVSDEDIELLAKTRSRVCLCPQSNHNLGVGCAPVQKFIERGIPLCLGTDSLASNTSLCLWQEMAFLKTALPSLSGRQILRMATLGGSLALGEQELGSIEAGKHASLIFLPVTASSGDEIEEAVVLEGCDTEVTWISQRIKREISKGNQGIDL